MSITSSAKKEEDLALENNLRPKTLLEFVGQEKLKDNLKIALTAAKKRKEPVDHILFYGPPGLGKTTLSYIAAKEMGTNIRVTSGPALERAGDLASILTGLQDGDILFVDEIHRLPRIVEESLYPALEEFHLNIVIGRGPSATVLKLDLPKFTLIGATTRIGLLTSPLRDRFGMLHFLDFYDTMQLKQIVSRNAKRLQVPTTEDGAEEIARRSRGTPRIANRLLKRVRDYAQVKSKGDITKQIAISALEKLDVDEKGLDSRDHTLLRTLIEKFKGGPVGLETLAAALSEEKDTLEEVYEPYLMQAGMLQRTPKGRMATALAYEHLGIRRPSNAQEGMF